MADYIKSEDKIKTIKEEKYMDNITSAEFLSDIIDAADDLNFNKNTKTALLKARYETMCRHSPVDSDVCKVPILFTPQSQMEPIMCDTCLQKEMLELVRKNGIHPVGSSCGHGVEQGYILVGDESVHKMHQLGYKPCRLDKHGKGINAFAPKTLLYEG